MKKVKMWAVDAIRAFVWFIIISSIVVFSAGAFSQFIYTDF